MNFSTAAIARHNRFVDYLLIGFVFLVGGCMAGLFGLLLDTALLVQGRSAFQVLFISNFLTGIVGCSLRWIYILHENDEQHVFEDRQSKVIIMRHFIPPALDIITKNSKDAGESQRQAITEQVRQIEWAISLVPRGWDLDNKKRRSKAVVIEMPLQPPPPPPPPPAAAAAWQRRAA